MARYGVGFNAAEHAAQNEAARREKKLWLTFANRPFIVKEAAEVLEISHQSARTLFRRLAQPSNGWWLYKKDGRLYLEYICAIPEKWRKD